MRDVVGAILVYDLEGVLVFRSCWNMELVDYWIGQCRFVVFCRRGGYFLIVGGSWLGYVCKCLLC